MTQMLGRLNRDETDPIFFAIKRHEAAGAAFAIAAENEDQDPEGFEAASNECCAAYDMVMSVKPTTPSGLMALANHLDDYLSEAFDTQKHSEGWSNGEIGDDALRALIIACRHLGEAQRP